MPGAVSRLGGRRVLLIGALALASVIGFLAVQSLASGTVYYLTPTEARDRHLATGVVARLGGLVESGSLRYEPGTRYLSLTITDGTTRVVVVGRGAPPALLREGAGAVVEGSFAADGTFNATSVIAKHDEIYAAPTAGATPPHRTTAP